MSPPKKKKKKKPKWLRPTKTAARSRLKNGITTTSGLTDEERLIVVAQGIEFHNSDLTGDDKKWRLPDCLLDESSNTGPLKIPRCKKLPSNKAEYYNKAQKEKYTILVITSKKEFHEYIEGKKGSPWKDYNNVLVMYDGHARYGRGPCLGTTDAPGNHWGTGDDPRVEGIFRMGFPYLYVPSTEILSHEYKAIVARQQSSDPNLVVNLKGVDDMKLPLKISNYKKLKKLNPKLFQYLKSSSKNRARTKGLSLAEADVLVKSFQDSVEDAKKKDSVLKTVHLGDINSHTYLYSILKNKKDGRSSLALYIDGPTGASEKFWLTYRYKKIIADYWDGTEWKKRRLKNPKTKSGRFRWPYVILHADWENTKSGTWTDPLLPAGPANPPARMDLKATKMMCRGFCHFGCSTRWHNYYVMRLLKKWELSADENNRLCYWTTSDALIDIGPYWLYHMMTYIPGRGGFSSRNWGDVTKYAKKMTNYDLSYDGRDYRVY